MLFLPPVPVWVQKSATLTLEEIAKTTNADQVPVLVRGLGELPAPEQNRLVNLLVETLPMTLGPEGRPALLEAIRIAYRKVPEGKELGMYHCQLRLAEARNLESLGHHEEALSTLDATIPKAPEGAAKVLWRMRESLDLVGKPAPAVTFSETLGEFKGLGKGKVVLLDFFAHWCKPCIAAFPELKSLRNDYQARGFEIAGLTRFYGYYGSRRDLAPTDEMAAMKGFYRDQALPWPVVYVKPEVEESYKLLSLPTTVVIDRKGFVRHVTFGFNPKEAGELRALIQRLLAEE